MLHGSSFTSNRWHSLRSPQGTTARTSVGSVQHISFTYVSLAVSAFRERLWNVPAPHRVRCPPSPYPGACKALQLDEDVIPVAPSPSSIPVPSSPLTPGTPVTPSAPSPVEGPGSSECVVCMETGVSCLWSVDTVCPSVPTD